MKVFDAGLEAHGIIAVGQIATGVIAFGQIATGVIAVGQLARGLISIGQLAVGMVAVGQVGIGLGYGAGMLGIGTLSGGPLTLAVLGRWPLRALLGGRRQIEPVTRHVGRWLLLAGLVAVVLLLALLPLWEVVTTAVDGQSTRR